MNFSGITRRIDELGRIVVPKEIRYNLGIRNGEPLEIYALDNKIVIKKFSQVGNIKEISQKYVDIISDICNIDIIITDRDKIVVTTNNIKHLINNKITEKDKLLIDNRETYISNNKESLYDILGYYIIMPIICNDDSNGLVIAIFNDFNKDYIKYTKIIQKLIVNEIDVS